MGGAGALYFAAGLSWAAVAYKALDARRLREAGGLIFWLILLFSALAVTALLPPVYVAIDRLAGMPNLSRLLGNGSILLASWLVQLSIWRLNYPERPLWPRVRSSGMIALAILATMAVLFVAAPVDGEEAADFTGRYAQEPTIRVYRAVFLGYLAYTAIEFIRLSWRYAGRTTRALLFLSEHLLIAGASLGLAYILHEISRILFSLAGLAYPVPDAAGITALLLAGALVLMIVGSTLPTWGRYVGAEYPARWLAGYRTYRQLYSLWHAISNAFPEVVLHPARWGSPLADVLTGRLSFRSYRRVIEIRDGYVRLQGYRDPRAHRHAAELCRHAQVPDEERSPILEAADVAAALRAHALHSNYDASNGPLPIVGGETVADDAGHLALVSQQFHRSRIVRATLAELDRDDKTREMPGLDMQTISPSPTKAQRLARFTTEIFAPAPTVAAMLVVVALHSTTSLLDAVRWGILVLVFTPLLPLLYLLYEVRRQRLTDRHVRLREQRPRILAVAIASIVFLLGLLVMLDAPSELIRLVAAGVVGLVSVTLVTLAWKISIHVAVVAGSVITLVALFGWLLLSFLPVIALTAWARVILQDHTPRQVLAGAILGATVAGIMFGLAQ